MLHKVKSQPMQICWVQEICFVTWLISLIGWAMVYLLQDRVKLFDTTKNVEVSKSEADIWLVGQFFLTLDAISNWTDQGKLNRPNEHVIINNRD